MIGNVQCGGMRVHKHRRKGIGKEGSVWRGVEGKERISKNWYLRFFTYGTERISEEEKKLLTKERIVFSEETVLVTFVVNLSLSLAFSLNLSPPAILRPQGVRQVR